MNRVQKRFVKDALDQLDRLTEWEAEFIQSIADKGDDEELSERQNAALNQIQRKLV